VSAENAAENRDTEVGHRSFAAVRAQAARSWRDALGTIDITGGTDEERTTFYTALYHALLHPNVFNDVNGEYMGYDQRLHRVERGREFYVQFAGWDMYRGHAQLLALLFPERANDINQSIVLMAQQKGTWVDGPTLNQAQARMSGDSLQVVVSEMDAFGSTGYDRRGALESMVRTQSLPADRTSRAYGYQYFTTGFIENRKGDVATSRVLEYSVDDFAIAQLARRLGDRATYARFMVRAQNWQHVFDDQSKEIRPRERTGFDRTMRLTVREDNARREQFNQSTGHQYGWMVPHNIGTLVDKRGGVEASTRALDTLMADLDAGAYDKTGNYLSNQPSFNSPYVYNWLRAPHRTTDVLRRAVTEMYDTTPSGLPGNDDQGSLSAWYVWANLGIAPVIYGTANLVVSAPMFEKVRIDSAGSGRVITIRAPGAGRGAPYTIGLSVNGEPRSASWLGEDFARAGGSLRFTMSATPGTWGTGAGDVPPSYTDGGDARNNIGVSPDGDGRMASLDLSDNSLSRERLAAAGAAPGAELPHGDTGAVFTWPDTEPGEPDNWLPYGQRVDLPDTRAAGISFLGLATNGPAQGAATVEYTDGSTQQVMVRLTDWSAGSPAFGNTALVQTVGRNNARGDSDTLPAKVFATAPEALDATRTVTAVILPQGSDRGVMHIFDVATSR
jgi:predicted alpha-1,2-mannosidase